MNKNSKILRKRTTKKSGFTLVEVMITSAVASIILLSIAQSTSYLARSSLALTMQQQLQVQTNLANLILGSIQLCPQAIRIPGTPTKVDVTALLNSGTIPVDVTMPNNSTLIFSSANGPHPLPGSNNWIIQSVTMTTTSPASSIYTVTPSNFFINTATISVQLTQNSVIKALGTTIGKSISLQPIFFTAKQTNGTGPYNIQDCNPQGLAGTTDSGWTAANPGTPAPSAGNICYTETNTGKDTWIICPQSYYLTGLNTSNGNYTCCKVVK